MAGNCTSKCIPATLPRSSVRASSLLMIGALLAAAPAADAVVHAGGSGRALHPARAIAAPTEARVVQITLLPSTIRLDGPHSSHYILVMGKRSDGSVVDLTDKAAITCSDPRVVSLLPGAVSGLRDGNAVVAAHYGSFIARVPAV